MDSAYDLVGAGLLGTDTWLLRDLHLRIRQGAVTVILGPSGTGKSTLLRALCAGPAPEGLAREGVWRMLGSPLAEAPPRARLFGQRRARERGGSRPSLAEVAHCSEPIVLLDEPERSLEAPDPDALVDVVRGVASRGAAVVVLHDLQLARRLGDEVALMCAGTVVATGSVPEFFLRPPTELAARFVREGNCWPGPAVPTLPSHFYKIHDQLAGMARPGLLRDVDEDLAAIALAGMTHVVTLTEEPFPAERLRAFGLTGRHFPIRDMDVPALGPTATLCRNIERAMKSGERVVVHCRAGLGRTGTILAAVLVWAGVDAREGIARVRTAKTGALQVRAQEVFVERFAEMLGRS